MQYIFSFFYLLLMFQFNIQIMGQNINQDIDKNILIGKFKPSQHPNFEKISIQYANKQNMYLQKEVLNAFIEMHEVAKKDNINLIIISSTRTFDQQKIIWENKWNGNTLVENTNLNETNLTATQKATKILTYSSMPGTSRHHWGTDIDLNSLNPFYFTFGKGKSEYKWLEENAHRFGFCQPYKDKGKSRLYGYEDEPWHWSYIPIAHTYIVEYPKIVQYNDISGFLGSELAPKIDIINKYVLNINTDCK
jgi:D-alanyl-D-alanine carboxypeptidase